MEQYIISISRQYGSGGHEIAEKLAERLGISLLDRTLLDDIAKEKGVDVENFLKYDEKMRNKLLSRRVRGYSSSMEDNLAKMQFKYIKNKADEGGSFVIVGRCAETVLKDYQRLFKVFILGDMDTRIQRVMRRRDMSERDAKITIKRHDFTRKSYHNEYSYFSWGDSKGYDLCINSSRLELDEVVDLLEEYVKKRFLQK